MKTAKGNVHLYVSHNLRIDKKKHLVVVVSLFHLITIHDQTFIILFIFFGGLSSACKIYLYT